MVDLGIYFCIFLKGESERKVSLEIGWRLLHKYDLIGW
jgi:hypothetical protein